MTEFEKQTIWVQAIIGDEKYIVTSKPNERSMYYLWKIENGKSIKISKGSNPTILLEKAEKGNKRNEQK